MLKLRCFLKLHGNYNTCIYTCVCAYAHTGYILKNLKLAAANQNIAKYLFLPLSTIEIIYRCTCRVLMFAVNVNMMPDYDLFKNFKKLKNHISTYYSHEILIKSNAYYYELINICDSFINSFTFWMN